VEVDLLVVPRASQTEVTGIFDGRIRVRLSATPVDGKANKALLQGLAKLLGVKRSALWIVSGATGRRKTVFIADSELDEVKTSLERAFVGN